MKHWTLAALTAHTGAAAEQSLSCGGDALARARPRLAALPPGGGADATARRYLLRALRGCPTDAAVAEEVGEGLRLLGEPAAALAVFRCAARRGVWRHPLQRVTRDMKHGLDSMAVFDPEAIADFPELQAALEVVQGEWKTLRADFKRALGNTRTWRLSTHLLPCRANGLCWEQTKLPSGGISGRWQHGDWRHFYIAQEVHGQLQCNSRLYPRICSVVERVKGLGLDLLRAQISTTAGPLTFIAAHFSSLQARIRLNCPIVQSENSTSVMRFPGYLEIPYEKGKCFWFDESYEHELLHQGEFRASLIIDVKHPGLDGRALHGSWAQSALAREPAGRHASLHDHCRDLPDYPKLHRHTGERAAIMIRENYGTSGKGLLKVTVETAQSEDCFAVQDGSRTLCMAVLTLVEGESPQREVQAFSQKHGLNLATELRLLDYVSASVPYHAGNDEPWSADHGAGRKKQDVLRHLRRRFGYGDGLYLEIGCDNGYHFAEVRTGFARSECVDPRPGGTALMTSDAYFSANGVLQDLQLVLVDGLHTGSQALRDVDNALARLAANGAIVMHDCNPNSEGQAHPENPQFFAFFWTGDVFRAVAALRHRDDLDVAVGDFDFGVAVVLPRRRSSPPPRPPLSEHAIWNMSYADFALRRRELLNLMSWDALLKWIG